MSHPRGTDPSDLRDRLEGCLKLGAVGDALGYLVEFDNADQIMRRHGPEGLRLSHLLAAADPVVSDDTQMTLFTAEAAREALAADDGRPLGDRIANTASAAYRRWRLTQDGLGEQSYGIAALPLMNRCRAPGLTCLKASADGAWGTPDRPINDGDGCGGVMRVAPLAFMEGTDAKGAMDLGMRAAALTHGHPSAWISSGVFTHMLWEVSRGAGFREAAASACAAASGIAGARQVTDLVDWAISRADSGAPATWVTVEYVGAGWNGREALAVAVYAVLAGQGEPERTLEIAAFHSGDSDSTASLAGQLMGASTGWKALEGSLATRCFARLDAAALVSEAVGWILPEA